MNHERLEWMLTGTCNLRCRHCYLDPAFSRMSVPDRDWLLETARWIAAQGIHEVVLTGGEPLTVDSFCDVVRELGRLGVAVSRVITNGTLLERRHLTALREAGHHPAISMSYDGDAGAHDLLRNAPGSAEKVLAAMDLCREEGFFPTALVTLWQGSAPVMRETLHTLASHGCTSVKVMHFVTVGRGCAAPEKLILTPREVLEAVCSLATYYIREALPMELYLDEFFYAPSPRYGWRTPAVPPIVPGQGNDVCRCMNDASVPFLTADGRLLPCSGVAGFPDWYARFPCVTGGSTEPAWQCEAMQQLLHHTPAVQQAGNAECSACPYNAQCDGGCRIFPMAAGEGINGRDPYLCEYYRNGWRERIVSAVRQGQLEALLR